jgi:hypothetical protein
MIFFRQTMDTNSVDVIRYDPTHGEEMIGRLQWHNPSLPRFVTNDGFVVPLEEMKQMSEKLEQCAKGVT